MSKKRLGADGEWPRVPTFLGLPEHPPGVPSGDHIVLDEEDERILDEVWAEIRSRPTKIFGRTLTPLPESTSASGGTTDDARAPVNGQNRDVGAGRQDVAPPGSAARPRKLAPPSR